MFKRWMTIALALLAGLLKPALVAAQPKCSLEHYTTANGLSDNRVMCIIKDREGFMWMGSWTGINRFDGHNFVTYKSHPGDSSELNNNRIDHILEGSGGMLWLKAYDNQVYRFDKKTEQFLSVSNLIDPGKRLPISVDKIVLLQHDHIGLLTKAKGLFLVKDPAAAKPTVIAALQDSLTGFHQDKQTRIWVATKHGLNCLQWQADQYVKMSLPAALQQANISCIAESETYMWFGAVNGQLWRFHKTTDQLQAIPVGNKKLHSLYVSRNTNKLYATGAGGNLFTIQPSTLQISSIDQYNGDELLELFEDSKGQLWIEPGDKGVVFFDPAKRQFQQFTQPNYSRYLHAPDEYHVFEDNRGIVWINMKGCGYGYYDTASATVKYFYNEAGSPDKRFSNMVSAQYYDANGILWLSTDEGGLEKIIFQPEDFAYNKVEPKTFLKAENDIRGLFVDSKDRMWIASKGRKLYVYDKGKLINNIIPNTPSFGAGAYAIMEDSKGNIWMGTKGDGLWKATPIHAQRDRYTLTHFMHDADDPYSINFDQVYSLLEDKQGRIWVGTFGGGLNLIEEKDGVVRFHHPNNSFPQYPNNACKRIRHIAADGDGHIWVGTTEGLLVFDPNTRQALNAPFARYGKMPGKKESLGDNDVQFVYRDHSNTMWVLTSSGGLNKAVGNGFRNYSMKEGLSSDYLLSCIEDRAHHLWIGTQNALSRFDPATEKFRNFTIADGLPQPDFSEASVSSFVNGEIVFGTMSGYIRFQPATIRNTKCSADIAFINPRNNLRLEHDQNFINIDYGVLDYRFNGKETYAYRLKGFETEWHDNKSARRATYTNLPPGDYVFEVKSTSEDLYSNIPYNSLRITILPPWWKTWWAYLSYLIIGIILLWIIRKNALTMFRLRQRIIIERKLADFRLQFFTNISHELRTPLTLIMNPLEEIARTEQLSPKGERHLSLVRKNALRLNRFINQLLDLRKAQSGKSSMKVSEVELVAFTRRIAGYFAELAEQKQIDLRIEAAVEPINVWMDAEKMDIVIYNLLANAFKFTPNERAIRIIIYQKTNGHIQLSVVDEGPGVPSEELDKIFNLYFEGQHAEGGYTKGTGIGLALSKEFVQLNHGTIEAHNMQPQGLNVTIELLPGKEHFEKDGVLFTNEIPDAAQYLQTTSLPEEIKTFIPQDAVDGSAGTEGLPALLLVEDNTELRSFLKDQLSTLFKVEAAENGEEGLVKAIEQQPDVILSDVMMPIMNGITMLDLLKNNPLTSHIPVVLLSARYSIESRIEGLRYGADQYLQKPFSNELLVASLQNLVNQRKRVFNALLHPKSAPGNNAAHTPVEINPPPISITSHDEQFLQKLIATVEEKMADAQFNIDVVAESLNMSRSPFYKKLKSLTGLSPVEFVREIRLKRSLQFLDAGEHNIATIAYEIGFNSAKYFSTCFKQRFGQTPSDYLKSNEKPTA